MAEDNDSKPKPEHDPKSERALILETIRRLEKELAENEAKLKRLQTSLEEDKGKPR